jgi:hypothetical protein
MENEIIELNNLEEELNAKIKAAEIKKNSVLLALDEKHKQEVEFIHVSNFLENLAQELFFILAE